MEFITLKKPRGRAASRTLNKDSTGKRGEARGSAILLAHIPTRKLMMRNPFSAIICVDRYVTERRYGVKALDLRFTSRITQPSKFRDIQ